MRVAECFDEPYLKIGAYEFTEEECSDLRYWFSDEQPKLEDLSKRERAYADHLNKGGQK